MSVPKIQNIEKVTLYFRDSESVFHSAYDVAKKTGLHQKTARSVCEYLVTQRQLDKTASAPRGSSRKSWVYSLVHDGAGSDIHPERSSVSSGGFLSGAVKFTRAWFDVRSMYFGGVS